MVEGSLARSYVRERSARRNKPAAWVSGSPAFEADEMDLFHMEGAHFPSHGQVVIFRDGSVAKRQNDSRRAWWSTCD